MGLYAERDGQIRQVSVLATVLALMPIGPPSKPVCCVVSLLRVWYKMSRLDLGVGYRGHDARQFCNLGLPVRRVFPDGLSPIGGSALARLLMEPFQEVVRKSDGKRKWGRGASRMLVTSTGSLWVLCFVRSFACSLTLVRLGPRVLCVTTRICGQEK